MTAFHSINLNTGHELEKTMKALTQKGKGLLAADESTGTITKRFSALNIPCTEDTRRDYRELLITTPNIDQFISGVILYEETLNQKSKNGIPFPELLIQKNIVPGIKVDKGLILLPRSKDENITQGLDGLSERLFNYKNQGARFAKWRAVYQISKSSESSSPSSTPSSFTPSSLAIQTNASILAAYASICQEAGIVPIVEPEILIDGDHAIDRSFEVTQQVMEAVFQALSLHRVSLEHMILKPSMVIPGKLAKEKASPEEIAKRTIVAFRRSVPSAVLSINFLSGGQTPEQATLNLNAMNQLDKNPPWNLSFSYARALQEPVLKAWAGKNENLSLAQKAFYHRAKLNSLATQGKYEEKMEMQPA